MEIANPFPYPPVIDAMREMYSSVPIPYGILDSLLDVVWHNESMGRSCPVLCQPKGLYQLAGYPAMEDVLDEIAETGSFRVPFNPGDIFTPPGLAVGAIPGTDYYFVQASAIEDTGTGSRPGGLEKTLCRFEGPIRRNLETLVTASQALPGLDTVRLAANAIQRAITTTMDFTRIINGLYPRRKIRIDLYSFLQEIMEAIDEFIGNGVPFHYHVPAGQTPIHTVTDTLLLSEIFGLLLSDAVESAQDDQSICVEAIASQTELQTFISITNSQPGLPPHCRISCGKQNEYAEAAAVFLGGSLSMISGEQKSVYRLTLPVCDDDTLKITPRGAALPLYPDLKSYLEMFLGESAFFVQDLKSSRAEMR